MRSRILIGLGLVAAIVAITSIDGQLGYPAFATLVVAAMTVLAVREVVDMVQGAASPFAKTACLATLALFGGRALADSGRMGVDATRVTLALLVAGNLLFLVQGLVRLQGGRDDAPGELARGVAASAFALLYVALPMTGLQALALTGAEGEGELLAASVVLISKCGDIGGYLAGTLFGRRRVMPRVSPKKSWEGSAAGLLLTLACAHGIDAARPGLLFGLQGWRLAVLALLVNLATQIGDFAESMLKRSVGVKDSGALLPGFGGALDILDSLVLAVPAAWLAAHALG